MTTRQVRLNTPQQIREKLPAHTGKKINIVLRDRTVFFGTLQGIDDVRLQFVNLRNETFSLPLSNISEIYLDVVQ